VILNKLSKLEMKWLEDPESEDARLLKGCLFGMAPPTPNFIGNPIDPSLEDEDNVLVELKPALQRFLQDLEPVRISPDMVSPIETSQFDDMAKKLEAKASELKANNGLLKQVLESQERLAVTANKPLEHALKAGAERNELLESELELAKLESSFIENKQAMDSTHNRYKTCERDLKQFSERQEALIQRTTLDREAKRKDATAKENAIKQLEEKLVKDKEALAAVKKVVQELREKVDNLEDTKKQTEIEEAKKQQELYAEFKKYRHKCDDQLEELKDKGSGVYFFHTTV